MENIGSKTAPSAASDKIVTKSTGRMDLDVIEIVATIFNLYFNSFRNLSRSHLSPRLCPRDLCCTINYGMFVQCILQLGCSPTQTFFQCASGNTRPE